MNKKAASKKKSPRQLLKKLMPFIVSAFICGVISYFSIGNDSEATNIATAFGERSLPIILTSFFLGGFVHIILHEAGHLICGLLTGYKFVSFRVGSIMFIKEGGKFKRKKFNLAGLVGQCLMSPPKLVNNTYPFVMYNLGGSLVNFILSGITFAIWLVLQDTIPYAGEIFIPTVCVGLLSGIMNILPITINGVSVDGNNIASLKRSEQARTAFWLLLTASARIISGERPRNIPAEWFEFADDYNFNDFISANLATMGLSRLIDLHDFKEAKLLAERIINEGIKHIELFKIEARCQLLFLEIIGDDCRERQEAIERIYTSELAVYIKASKAHLSMHRLMYAYVKLVSYDDTKAAKILESFNNTCLAYPYVSLIESERELIEIVDSKTVRREDYIRWA